MWRRLALLVIAGIAGLACAVPAQGLQVTFAARVCERYTDITANKARNNVQESLQDLGADTPYQSADLVDAVTEDRVQPNCRPLVGWRFTLGTGISTRASVGRWGALSTVTTAFSDQIATRASTPLLSDFGAASGASLPGAVTVTLSQAEVTATSRGQLVAQGGTPTDPVGFAAAPDQYGFGALRCAADNRNGDNVEYVEFPTGRTHVVCFAYYVTPPPSAGTIVVRKQTEGAPTPAVESFSFSGNVSYAADSAFALSVAGNGSASETFVRGATGPGDQPWTFAEAVPPGWTLTDVACASATGASTVTSSVASGSTSVTLAAGDTVTCTYTDRYVPPPGRLLLRKVTLGDVGTFPFTVTPLGGGGSVSASATTTEEGVAAEAVPEELLLAPESYTVSEQTPQATGGDWALTSVVCGDASLPLPTPQTIAITSGQGLTCTYTNTFTPDGRIVVRTVTLGGTGTFRYAVTGGARTRAISYRLASETQRAGVAVVAGGDDLSRVTLQSYAIRQLAPQSADGAWELLYVTCNGSAFPVDQGRVVFSLTRPAPAEDCTFVNRLVPAPSPEPPTTTPPQTPTPPAPPPSSQGNLVRVPPAVAARASPRVRLRLTKRPDRRTIRLGQTVRYRVRLTNLGPSPSVGTTVVERRFAVRGGARLVAIRPSRGRCGRVRRGHAFVPVCRLGTLRAGETASVLVVVRPHRVGAYRNRSVASTSSRAVGRRRAVAVARVVVLPRLGVRPVAGLARAG